MWIAMRLVLSVLPPPASQVKLVASDVVGGKGVLLVVYWLSTACTDKNTARLYSVCVCVCV